MKIRLLFQVGTFLVFALNIYLFPTKAFTKSESTKCGLVTQDKLKNFREITYSDECDIIVLINGNEIKAKIIEVTKELIKYKKCENLNGSIFLIKKSEVFMLKYPNGIKNIIIQNNANSLVQESNQSQKAPLPECDNIVLLNGEEIRAKILEDTADKIKYKICDNKNGLTNEVKKNEVFKLNYFNGVEKIISQKNNISIKIDSVQNQKKDVEKSDTIILINGSEILGKVLKITKDVIKYNKFDNITGPSNTIKKSEVSIVKFQNGERKVISQKETNTVKSINNTSPTVSSESPDLIILTNGEEINAKVLEETSDEIKYKKFDNISGPISTINKSEVFLLKYSAPQKAKKK